MSNKNTGTPARLSGEQITLFEAIALIAFGDASRSLQPAKSAEMFAFVDEETGQLAPGREAEAIGLLNSYIDEKARHRVRVALAADRLGKAIMAGIVPARGELLLDGIRVSSRGTKTHNPIPVHAEELRHCNCEVVFDLLVGSALDGGRIVFRTGTDPRDEDELISYRSVHLLRAPVEKIATEFARETDETAGDMAPQHPVTSNASTDYVEKLMIFQAKLQFDQTQTKLVAEAFLKQIKSVLEREGKNNSLRSLTTIFRFSKAMIPYRRRPGETAKQQTRERLRSG